MVDAEHEARGVFLPEGRRRGLPTDGGEAPADPALGGLEESERGTLVVAAGVEVLEEPPVLRASVYQ